MDVRLELVHGLVNVHECNFFIECHLSASLEAAKVVKHRGRAKDRAAQLLARGSTGAGRRGYARFKHQKVVYSCSNSRKRILYLSGTKKRWSAASPAVAWQVTQNSILSLPSPLVVPNRLPSGMICV